MGKPPRAIVISNIKPAIIGNIARRASGTSSRDGGATPGTSELISTPEREPVEAGGATNVHSRRAISCAPSASQGVKGGGRLLSKKVKGGFPSGASVSPEKFPEVNSDAPLISAGDGSKATKRIDSFATVKERDEKLEELVGWMKETLDRHGMLPKTEKVAADEVDTSPEKERRGAIRQLLEAGGEVDVLELPAHIVEVLRRDKPVTPQESRRVIREAGYDPDTFMPLKAQGLTEGERERFQQRLREQINEALAIEYEVTHEQLAEVKEKVDRVILKSFPVEAPSYSVGVSSGQVEVVFHPAMEGELDGVWVFPFFMEEDEIEAVSDFSEQGLKLIEKGKTYQVVSVERTLTGRLVRVKDDYGQERCMSERLFVRREFTRFNFMEELRRRCGKN